MQDVLLRWNVALTAKLKASATWMRQSGLTTQLTRLVAALIICALIAAVVAIGAPVAWATEGVHIVTPGESLAGIANKYNVSLAALSAYNGITDPNLIRIGQKVMIPPVSVVASTIKAANPDELPGDQGYHTVVRGESLTTIARTYGLTVSDLMRLNALENANQIWVGQKLRVTARVAYVESDIKPEPKLELAQTIYTVQEGDTLAAIAKAHDTTIEQVMLSNGLPNAAAIWPGQRLRIEPPPAKDTSFGIAGAPEDGKRWIEIDLSDQTLTAWQGDVAVLHTSVSTGKPSTPTVVGRFQIQTKLESQRMTGEDYDLPGVPWVMYFFEDYAIHGAYWHMSFGTPLSHGCVNMRPEEAQALYAWADLGTEVVVVE